MLWRELAVLAVLALACALVVKTYVVQAFFIPSASMEDTLQVGDRVLVNKLVYHVRPIHRGDVVVFRGTAVWDAGLRPAPHQRGPVGDLVNGFARVLGSAPDGDDFVKRVIGLPGDRVRCCDARGRITVGGIALSERSYLFPGDSPSAQRFDVVVPRGRLWVMGDRRADSLDSRALGTIPVSQVIGRAFVVIWPLNRMRGIPIPSALAHAAAAARSRAAGAVPLLAGMTCAMPVLWLRRRMRRD